EWRTVVGVVDDLHEAEIRLPNRATVYWTFLPRRWMSGAPWLVIRAAPSLAEPAGSVRQMLQQSAPDVPILAVEWLPTRLRAQRATAVLATATTTLFAAGSMILVICGVFAATCKAISRQSRSLAIRMALGASQVSIYWIVLRRVAVLLVGGEVAG